MDKRAERAVPLQSFWVTKTHFVGTCHQKLSIHGATEIGLICLKEWKPKVGGKNIHNEGLLLLEYQGYVYWHLYYNMFSIKPKPRCLH